MRTLMICLLAACLTSCASKEDTDKLSQDIQYIEQQLQAARTEQVRYGEGSALYVLTALRIGVHEQTEAMLKQKWMALRWAPRFSYTVAGEAYTPPADGQEKLKQLKAERDQAKLDAVRAEVHALETGGLIGVIARLTAELRHLPVAQLDYQILALEHGFPPFAAQVKMPDQAKLPGGLASGTSRP